MKSIYTGSLSTLEKLDHVIASTSEEKKKTTINHFSFVLGAVYAIFLGIVGLLVSLFNPIIRGQELSDWLMIYILTTSLAFICLLIIDVKWYTSKIEKAMKEKEAGAELAELNQNFQTELEQTESVNGERLILNQNTRNDCINIEHKYCFTSGRHAVSAYLKIGAAMFALGHLVHVILVMVIEMYAGKLVCWGWSFIFAQILQFILVFIRLILSLFCTNETLASFGLLHLIASNICFWLLSIANETQLALKVSQLVTLNTTSVNGDETYDKECEPPVVAMKIFEEYAPYLYPFTVEFSIIVAGIFYMVWSNVGNCKHRDEEALRQFITRKKSLLVNSMNGQNEEASSPHSFEINVSCHRSSSGIFTSIIVMILLATAIVLGFIFGNIRHGHFENIADVMTISVELVFYTVMLVAAMLAYNNIRKFDVKKQHVPLMDDLLLFICVPAFFVETIFTVVATIKILNIIRFLNSIIMCLQMTMQILFVYDGQRRCSNSRKLIRNKPGRQLVLFLLVTNVAMWVLYTFGYKSSEYTDERYLFYGKEAWVVIGHTCMPLIMFFRFHSSVCIADIWSHTFTPGSEEY